MPKSSNWKHLYITQKALKHFEALYIKIKKPSLNKISFDCLGNIVKCF